LSPLRQWVLNRQRNQVSAEKTNLLTAKVLSPRPWLSSRDTRTRIGTFLGPRLPRSNVSLLAVY